MFLPFDPSVWHGRIDSEEGPLGRRWHQQVLSPRAEVPGTALIGFACDAGVARNHGRIGAAGGPAAIRAALAGLAWHGERPLYDAGDVRCDGDALEAAQQELGGQVAALLDAGHRPLVLGGGHEVAFGSWQGLAAHCSRQSRPPVIGIINLDAHFDLRAGDRASSGTPFRQIADDCAARGWPFHYACLGIAAPSNTAALFARARELGVQWVDDQSMRDWHPAILGDFIDRVDAIHLSIDLDVLPASVAPGVSAPAAFGVELAVIERIAAQVRASGKLRLAELAELNPRLDIDSHTARIAARLAFQLL